MITGAWPAKEGLKEELVHSPTSLTHTRVASASSSDIIKSNSTYVLLFIQIQSCHLLDCIIRDEEYASNTGYLADNYAQRFIYPGWGPEGWTKLIQGHACYDPTKVRSCSVIWQHRDASKQSVIWTILTFVRS